jgi:hypothetical protein
MCNVDSGEKPALAGLQWRRVAGGSQRGLGRLKALPAAPLQVSNRRELFQQNPMLRYVPNDRLKGVAYLPRLPAVPPGQKLYPV